MRATLAASGKALEPILKHAAPIARGTCKRCFIPAHIGQIAVTLARHDFTFAAVIEMTVLLMVILDYAFHDSDKS